MIALLGAVIIAVVSVLIKIYDKEFRKEQWKKTIVVYAWLFGVVLVIIQIFISIMEVL